MQPIQEPAAKIGKIGILGIVDIHCMRTIRVVPVIWAECAIVVRSMSFKAMDL